jgi:hypothetical protein
LFYFIYLLFATQAGQAWGQESGRCLRRGSKCDFLFVSLILFLRTHTQAERRGGGAGAGKIRGVVQIFYSAPNRAFSSTASGAQ